MLYAQRKKPPRARDERTLGVGRIRLFSEKFQAFYAGITKTEVDFSPLKLQRTREFICFLQTFFRVTFFVSIDTR